MKNRKKVKEEMSHVEKYVAAMSPEELEEERCQILKNSKIIKTEWGDLILFDSIKKILSNETFKINEKP